MDARIQFRVDQEVKLLAQQAAERKGSTLSDMCRELALNMAKEQEALMNHEKWLVEQVREAHKKIAEGKSQFVSNDMAQDILKRHLNKLAKNA